LWLLGILVEERVAANIQINHPGNSTLGQELGKLIDAPDPELIGADVEL
jgi:hypothetical protein